MTLGDPNQVYGDAFRTEYYKMPKGRIHWTRECLAGLFKDDGEPQSYADIGSGKSEALLAAREVGYIPAFGFDLPRVIEIQPNVPGLRMMDDITSIPAEDQAFDVVTCLDVREHIPEPKVDDALREVWRITKKICTFQIALYEEAWGVNNGYGQLHVTVHPEAWWLDRIQAALDDTFTIIDIGSDRGAGRVAGFQLRRKQ